MKCKHADLAIPATARGGRIESIQYLDNLLATIEGRLTPRERAVCSRALAGLHAASSNLRVRAPPRE